VTDFLGEIEAQDDTPPTPEVEAELARRSQGRKVKVKHWTKHALERFIERYLQGENAHEFTPEQFEAIVPRIEAKFRGMFDTDHFRDPRRSKVFVAVRMWCHRKDGMVKVKLVYDHRTRTVVTAWPEFFEKAVRIPALSL